MTPKIYNYTQIFTVNRNWYYNPTTNQFANKNDTPSTTYSGFRMTVSSSKKRNFIYFRGNKITAGNYYLKYTNNSSTITTVPSTITYDSVKDETVIYFDRPSGMSSSYVFFTLSNSQVGENADNYITNNFIYNKAGNIGWQTVSIYKMNNNYWNYINEKIYKRASGSWTT